MAPLMDIYLSARCLAWLVISCGVRDTVGNSIPGATCGATGGIMFIFRSGGVSFFLDDCVNLQFNRP